MQVGVKEDISCRHLEKESPAAADNYQCPGEAIFGVLHEVQYLRFLIYNTVSFIASLSVCLLLVSGIPLKHRFVLWFLSIGMCITITSLALTYFAAIMMVTPDRLLDKAVEM